MRPPVAWLSSQAEGRRTARWNVSFVTTGTVPVGRSIGGMDTDPDVPSAPVSRRNFIRFAAGGVTAAGVAAYAPAVASPRWTLGPTIAPGAGTPIPVPSPSPSQSHHDGSPVPSSSAG